MKIVPEGCIGSVRQFDTDSPDIEENNKIDNWTRDPIYVKVMERILPQMKVGLQDVAKSSLCFAANWADDSGECPETTCDLRSFCQNAHRLYQIEITQPVIKNVEEPTGKSLADNSNFRSLNPNHKVLKRKYCRKQYQPTGCNKPIDLIVAAFDKALGNPNPAPKGYSKKAWKGCTDKIVKRQCASYYSVILPTPNIFISPYSPIVRMWTNAEYQASIDIVPELVAPIAISDLSKSKAFLGSDKKLHPFTHRVTIYNADEAIKLAGIIKDRFKL